jgi:quercetin dioxygenase-like cupin family protein
MQSPIQAARLDEPDTVSVGREEITFRVTGGESGGALSAFEVRMPAGGGPPMLHRHDPFELYRVERGELAFYIEGDGGTVRRTVGRGGALVSIPGGREHTIRNESGDEARALVLFSPGDEIERFVREAAALADGGDVETSGLAELASAHGIEFTRPLPEVA